MSENPYTSPQPVDEPPVPANSLPATADFKDRTAGLIVFGILQVLMGGFCALMVPMMVFAMIAGQQAGAGKAMNPMMMIPALMIYAGMAVILVWLGIGSALARRWARALTLVLSWMWLITGLITTVFCVAFVILQGGVDVIAASFRDQMAKGPQGQQIPQEAMMAVVLITGVMLVCIYIILPGIFVLFYRSKHVKATCECKDLKVRWTDRCPLPVLALSLILGFSAFSMIWMLPYGGLFPFFGRFISGVGGVLVIAVMMLLLGYLAWGTYRLKMAAWWGTLVLITVWLTSVAITFSRVGLIELYEKMGMPEEQIQMIEKMGIVDKLPMAVGMGIGLAVYVGFLLFVRRYFVAAAGEKGS